MNPIQTLQYILKRGSNVCSSDLVTLEQALKSLLNKSMTPITTAHISTLIAQLLDKEYLTEDHLLLLHTIIQSLPPLPPHLSATLISHSLNSLSKPHPLSTTSIKSLSSLWTNTALETKGFLFPGVCASVSKVLIGSIHNYSNTRVLFIVELINFLHFKLFSVLKDPSNKYFSALSHSDHQSKLIDLSSLSDSSNLSVHVSIDWKAAACDKLIPLFLKIFSSFLSRIDNFIVENSSSFKVFSGIFCWFLDFTNYSYFPAKLLGLIAIVILQSRLISSNVSSKTLDFDLNSHTTFKNTLSISKYLLINFFVDPESNHYFINQIKLVSDLFLNDNGQFLITLASLICELCQDLVFDQFFNFIIPNFNTSLIDFLLINLPSHLLSISPSKPHSILNCQSPPNESLLFTIPFNFTLFSHLLGNIPFSPSFIWFKVIENLDLTRASLFSVFLGQFDSINQLLIDEAIFDLIFDLIDFLNSELTTKLKQLRELQVSQTIYIQTSINHVINTSSLILSCLTKIFSFLFAQNIDLFQELFPSSLFLILECFSFNSVLLNSFAINFFQHISNSQQRSIHELLFNNLDYILDSATSSLRFNNGLVGSEFASGLFKLTYDSIKNEDQNSMTLTETVFPFLTSFANEILTVLPQSSFKSSRSSLLSALRNIIKPLSTSPLPVDWRNVEEKEESTGLEFLIYIIIKGTLFCLDCPSSNERMITLKLLYDCFTILSHHPFKILSLMATSWDLVLPLVSLSPGVALGALSLVELFLIIAGDFILTGGRAKELIISLVELGEYIENKTKSSLNNKFLSLFNSIVSLVLNLDETFYKNEIQMVNDIGKFSFIELLNREKINSILNNIQTIE
ncbi:hypothetical protein P9112_002844 [Eukaryota sp. TZLM1-RC]